MGIHTQLGWVGYWNGLRCLPVLVEGHLFQAFLLLRTHIHTPTWLAFSAAAEDVARALLAFVFA